MPVEIFELIVRAQIQEEAATDTAATPTEPTAPATQPPDLVDVVDQVHEILKRKKER